MTALPRRARALVAVVGLAAAAALAASASALVRSPPGADFALLAGAAAFLAGFLLLERTAVTFVWRGHKLSTCVTEGAILLGLVALPGALVVLLVAAARLAFHVHSRRPLVKGVFNVAHGTMAAAAGAGTATALVLAGLDPLLSGALGAAVYSLFNELLLATLFATLEDVPSMRVYSERLLAANLLSIATGIPAGLALLGLWRLHPVAVLAAVPLAFLVHRNAALQARVDREVAVRRRLGEDSNALIGTSDAGVIASLALRTCRDLLDASRARMTLETGERFEEAFDESPTPTRPPLELPILGRDGSRLGSIAVWERPVKPRYGDDERALLAIVAGQAAHALESATALVQLAAQRDLLARQEKLSALGMLMAGVAHEINNPLTYMRLRLDLMRRESTKALDRPDATPAERAHAESTLKHAETFSRGIERLATLCSSLKSVARPGDGQRRPTRLGDLAGEVVTIVRAGHKEIDFRLDLASDAPPVEASPAELHQVLLNLVKNATEAVGDRSGGFVRVATRAEGSQVVLEVEDNGPGVPPDAQKRLFLPFFTTKAAGTGLGLSISRQIVTAHGGDLTFATTPGGGTTFYLRLPAAPRSQAA